MKRVRKLNFEMADCLRGSVNLTDTSEVMAKYIGLGYFSSKRDISEIDLDLILNSSDIKDSTKIAFNIIEEHYEKLNGIFEMLDDSKLSSEVIAKILVILKSSFFTPGDFRLAFEDMLEMLSEVERKDDGYSQTPSFINKLLVEVLEPKDGEFYDGTFGLGGDAIEAYKFAEQYGNKIKIYGEEIYNKTYAIANLRMFINGIEDYDIKLGDTLINPLFIEEKNNIKKFDNIIMNPPLGLPWKDKEAEIVNDKFARFIYGTPSTSNSDWLFISTALKSLNEKGKAVVITTLGSLFRSGAEGRLRKNIIGFDYIESVISLQSGLFINTGISAAMIVFNMNKKESDKNKIQFINADDIYENVRRGKNILTEKNIKYIVDIYRNKKEIENVSKIVELKDIEDGNILPSKYIIKTQFESDNFGKVKIHLDKLKATKTFDDIANFYRGINVTSKNIQDSNGNYKIINLADIKDGKIDIDSLPKYKIENNARVESYKVLPGDIIISSRGTTKVCIIPEHEEDVLISQNFIGVRLKAGNNPDYIKEFLESPIGQFLIDSRKTGTAVAIINPKDLKEIPIVSMDTKEQENIITEYKSEENDLEKQIQELKERLDGLKLDLYDKMSIKDSFEIMK